MLPSSGRSIGEQSVTTLPANRSIIIADSRFRDRNILDTPYNFNCDLGGTGIYSKELYYQKLFWNQPIFSHNNASCELRFQMNGNENITYVVYVTPFVMFQQYDGNIPGSSLLTPQPYSYAANLEMAFNGDVRTIPQNLTLVNGDGKIRDPTDPLHTIIIRFRYSPTKGFCCYPLQDSTTPNYYYTIRFLPCSFISQGHFVHGFGVYTPNSATLEYVPYDFFGPVIWSDCTPNLLPTRYIVIQSQELNKDRRLISFHNGNFSNFVNELGIFSINPVRTGVFHEVGVGDDATVISLRDDYTPQSFRIQILDEYGNLFGAGDPLSAVLQSTGIEPADVYSFLSGPLAGRGNPIFMDYLIFGYRVFRNGEVLSASGVLNFANPFPLTGMSGAVLYSQPLNYSSLNVAQNLDMTRTVPLSVTSTSLSPNPVAQGLGFGTSTAINSSPFLNDAATYGIFTQFTWYPNLNPDPDVKWEYDFAGKITTIGGLSTSVIFYVMFDASTFQPIATAHTINFFTTTVVVPIQSYGTFYSGWDRNPDYVFPTQIDSSIKVGFCLAWCVNNGPYSGMLTQMYNATLPPGPTFVLRNKNGLLNTQLTYVPPETDNGKYAFGDPLALALPEEVIHEIAAILEYN